MDMASKTDMDPADIKAAIEKKGLSLAGLSVAAGYSASACAKALSTPWPKVESVIADALNTKPKKIWPTRYDSSGAPIPRSHQNPRKSSSAARRGHVQRAGAG